jgi:uncharacterized protein (DUF433 family)
MSQLALIVVNEEGHHILAETNDPAFGYLRHLSLVADRDAALSGSDSRLIRASLGIAVDVMNSVDRVPADGWLYEIFSRRPWLSYASRPNIAGLRGRRIRLTKVLSMLAKEMSATRVVDELKLVLAPSDDLYCVLQYAAEVLQHLPADLERERRQHAERLH